jgi:Predicted xylanase/chitin deacetylase
MNFQFPRILRPLIGRNLVWCKKSSSSKVVYLTFDDGPTPEITRLVLNLLDEYGIKATFFCVGENVEKYPDIYNDILMRGHKTGNHTFNHLKGFKTKTEKYVENVRRASEYIESNLFRPPHGQIKSKQSKQLQNDYKIIMWDIITHDYNRMILPESVFKNVKKHVRNGSIIVFHDSTKAKNNMLTALPLTIEYLNSQGFRYEVL